MEWMWKDLIRALLPIGSSVEDGFVIMAILCNYRFDLSQEYGEPYGAEQLSPLTQSLASEVIADVWPYPKSPAAKPQYWRNLYQERLHSLTPHDVPKEKYDWERHERMLQLLRLDRRITDVTEE